MSSWFVYLLLCKDSSVYTGITTDVDRRVSEHKAGTGSKYVASKGFWKLLFSLQVSSRSEASKVEYAVKQLSRDEKFRFFREHNDKVFDAFS
ncbi:MAG: GIY-YIG nuclease family protein [Candidatus Woesearchaeota archaeon]